MGIVTGGAASSCHFGMCLIDVFVILSRRQNRSKGQHCCCSVAETSPNLFHPIDFSIPGFSVLHYPLELAQTHVHWVSEAIQPSYPLFFPSPPALNLSQNQDLFQWVTSLPPHGPQHCQASLSSTAFQSLVRLVSIESVMPSNHLILCCAFSCPQFFSASGSFPGSQLFASSGQSIGASPSASVLPMNIQAWYPLGVIGLISLLSKGLSRVFSNATVQKDQFFDIQLSLWSNSHIYTWLLEKL